MLHCTSDVQYGHTYMFHIPRANHRNSFKSQQDPYIPHMASRVCDEADEVVHGGRDRRRGHRVRVDDDVIHRMHGEERLLQGQVTTLQAWKRAKTLSTQSLTFHTVWYVCMYVCNVYMYGVCKYVWIWVWINMHPRKIISACMQICVKNVFELYQI